MNIATLILTPALTLALIWALAQFARLLRGWYGARRSELTLAASRGRIALEDEKERLLMTLRDLELEHEMGKLSDSDYQALRQRHEADAIRVIERLEGP